VAATLRLPTGEKMVCPTALCRKLVWDAHKQALAGAQGVLTKLQLWWYWPYMESEIRRRVRQCETCQASKHGRPPDEAGRWNKHVERPWQVEVINLVGNMCGTPQRGVVRRGRPLPAREVCPPATEPPPPLLEPSTGSEVQKPLEGGAPSGDTKETTLPKQRTKQIPVHRKDLVRDRIMCGRCKDSTGHRMGKRANIDFCLGGITSPSHVVQPRCSFFPQADTATSRRTWNSNIATLIQNVLLFWIEG